MAQPQNYKRDQNGFRFQPGGMTTVQPLDNLPPGKYAYLQNVRAFQQQQLVARTTTSTAIIGSLPSPVHTLRVLNDTSAAGPVGGYVRVIGAAGNVYVNSTEVASGLSGNPLSLCPFRPNSSVQPWMYVGDSSMSVTITANSFVCVGMLKIRSDGTTEKWGVKEPQIAPTVSTQSYTTTGTDTLPATTYPWTNAGGLNPSYNYSHTSNTDGTSPIIITGGGPFLVAGSTVTLTVTGTATVNGASHAPGDAGPTGATYPGNFIVSPTIVVGCWTDASGNILTSGTGGPFTFPIGASATLTVPTGAEQLHVGIDSASTTFNANSGNFTINWSVTVNAIATVLSTLGEITAYVWGDSPHSGPVGSYIWKNPNDSGSGTVRSITDPVPGASPSGNSWIFDSSPEDGTVPVNWSVLNSDGSVASTIPLFSPALESNGYQDFNCAIVGSLFVPTAGTYFITFQYKDQIMVGMSAGATATYSSGTSPLPTSPVGSFGQTISVVNGLPLVFVSNPNGSGSHQTTTMAVTFSGAGVYQIEIDWDYWYHSGRSLIMTCPSTSPHSPTIPPISANIRTGVQYRYVYRNSKTGATSNPSPESAIQDTPVVANEVTSVFSNDPQVDVVDYYRLDTNLTNFTYVATGPNDGLGGTIGGVTYNTPIEDELSDTEIAANQVLSFDNYEPFPITDLPKKGVVNVTGGVITWVSGDQFNTRWLPGTEIIIGSPTGNAYSFISRPISTTVIDLEGVPDGTNIAYEIPEPILAAQPMPYVWGPTDNTAYDFAVGDPNNPGTLYFTKGNMPDSAPETNQIAVTSPSEPLVNGVKTAAMAMVWSTERRWLIYPTFTSALATVSGVEGQPFNVVEAIGCKGLYMPNCVCTDGGEVAYFRAKDGIYACVFGGPDECLSDDIYNLFPREGFTPSPITIGNYIVYPPNDSVPDAQQLSFANTVLYYDYQDSEGNYRTLVYDLLAKGWSVDAGQNPFSVHSWEEGNVLDTVMVGTFDGGGVGSVRTLGTGNAETATSVVIPGSQNAGDARAFKRVGDVFIKALVTASNPITVALWANRYLQSLSGFSPTSLTGTGSLLPYVVDFTAGFGNDLIDVGVVLSWNTNSSNVLDLWQPDFIMLPESTQDRPTDWGDLGNPGTNFVQGLVIEANTFNSAKAIAVEDELGALHTPNESPFTLNGQQKIALSFTPPFISHIGRIVSTDGVPWEMWGYQFISQPYPELAINWSTELMAYGKGWGHLRMMNVTYIAPQPVTIVLFFDQWPTITLTNILPATSSQLYPTKTKIQVPANKSKLVGITLSSSQPWRCFMPQMEFWWGEWGRGGGYNIVQPVGGAANQGAEV